MIKKFLTCSLVAACLLTTGSAFANTDDTEGALGGWTEGEGNWTNSQVRATSTASHRGYTETQTTFPEIVQKRAVGHTYWEGVYHYTRARLVKDSAVVMVDSGRKWGTTSTTAITGWGKIGWTGRTFYGK